MGFGTRFIACIVGLVFAGAIMGPLAAQTAPHTKPQWLPPASVGVPGIEARWLEVADINEDAFPDVVAMSGQGAEFWVNDGQGTLSLQATFETPEPAFGWQMGDWDGDGDLDGVSVFASPRIDVEGFHQREPTPISLWINDGEQRFTRGAELFLGNPDIGLDDVSIVVGDLNADGNEDFVIIGGSIVEDFRNPQRITNEVSSTASVFLSLGDGRFEMGEPFLSSSRDVFSRLLMDDLDGDGDLDLLQSVGHGTQWMVWTNVGEGSFESSGFRSQLPDGLVLTPFFGEMRRLYDFDGDGDRDMVVPVLNSNNFIYSNNGSGRLTGRMLQGLGRFATTLALLDVNGDDVPDILGNGQAGGLGFDFDAANRSRVRVRVGLAEGGFEEVQAVGGPSPLDLVVGDFDQQAGLDIAVLSRSRIEVWLQGDPIPLDEDEVTPAVVEQSAVRNRIALLLGKASDRLTEADLAGIDELNLADLGLSTLALPVGLTNLRSLILDGNRITTLKLPEDGLKIDSITLRNNQSRVVTLKGPMPSLQRLVLTGADVRDLVFDGTFANLEVLGLWATQIRDFSFLPQLPSLRLLNLGDMGLNYAIFPVGTPNLEELTLSRNRLRELIVPRGFSVEQLTGLSMSNLVFYNEAFIGEGRARILDFNVTGTDSGELRVNGGPGDYQIEFSLFLDSWETVETFTYRSIATAVHAVPVDTSSASGFYRVVRAER